MSTTKNPTAVQVGQRIKQARRMAGFETAAQLLATIPEWGSSRLGNYEAGLSLPSPDDVKRIADATQASPCWIMFGAGPIRASGRDVQAIRHQNLEFLFDRAKHTRGEANRLLKAIGLSRKKLDELLANPFQNFNDRLARNCEKYAGKPKGWMDEQHVESDPVCAAFPEDMRQLMTLFSNLEKADRGRILRMVEAYVGVEDNKF